MDCGPSGSSVHGISQARILEWVAIPFSKGSSHPGIEPRSPTLWADSLPGEPQGLFLSQFSLSVVSNSLQTHGLQKARLPCPSPTPRDYSNSCPYNLDFQREKTQNNTSTFKWKLSFQGSTLGAFELFSSNVANAKNNFVTISLELLQSWFMNLVRKLAPFYM